MPDHSPAHEATLAFRNATSAETSLKSVEARVSAGLAASIRTLLTESPDPDTALHQFERFLNTHPQALAAMERAPQLAHYALAVFANSRFLGETLIQNPDVLSSFLRDRSLDRSLTREAFHEGWARFRARSFETDMALLLARYKRREYIRILLRDLLKIAPLAETTAEISALSDVLIAEALREADSRLRKKYGVPQHLDAAGRLAETPFTVVSLGKLGGNELNYSSDIDLLYLYGEGETPQGASVSNREYFVRLAQDLTDILARANREGPVFRIDMRLRPQGTQGELAVSRDHAVRYYEAAAQDWELQALLKARHSAGDAQLAREFLNAVRPHVYTDRVNFAAIETAVRAREKMETRRRQRLPSSQETVDLKLDRGGIRDIEFLVQCLQRVYGGQEPWLRSGGTLFSLQKLHDKDHISGHDFHELTQAYEFLRHVEHRLQLRLGQQTHRLPEAADDLAILARSLEGWWIPERGEFKAVIAARMAAVSEIYNRIIHQHQLRQHQKLLLDSEFELHPHREPGADQPYQQMLQRLGADAPELHEIAGRTDLSQTTRRNLQRFLTAAVTSAARYGVARRHAGELARALPLLEASEYLTEILTRHPEEIATLAEIGHRAADSDSGLLFPVPPGWGEAPGDPVFQFLASSATPEGERLALLRRHYRHRVFVSGARDLMELRPVYSSLAAQSAAAEEAIRAALMLADAPDGLGVMALGRLGAGEFDVLSDADLLFVRAASLNAQEAIRTAERMVQILAAYTREGIVFPVDLRLRPRGSDGELVVTVEELAAYFVNGAQPWEALSYTKLRFIAGSALLGDEAVAATRQLWQRYREDSGFTSAVAEMRLRVEQSERGESWKTSAGGIYDVDFLVNRLLVQHGLAERRGNLRDRLWRLAESGALSKSDAAALDHAAEFLRTLEHVVRLITGRARKWLPAAEHALAMTEQVTGKILRRDFPQGIEAELRASMQRVREVYQRASESN